MRKTRRFASYDEYETWANSFDSYEYQYIPSYVDDGFKIMADLMTECKSWQTAVRRFMKAFGDINPDVKAWIEGIQESCENNYFADRWHGSECKDSYGWGVEEVNDGVWYVFLNISGCYAGREEKVEAVEEAEITTDPDEYQDIQDSMTKTFYEFCTGEKIPENWKEIVKEERAAKAAKPVEAVEIVLESIVQDPEYFDTPIPPRHDPEPQPPAPKSGGGRGAAETVAFSLCLGLAYAVYGAKELAVILFYAIQAGLITLLTASRIGLEAALRWWVKIYPHIEQNSRKTAVCAVRMAKEAVVMMAIIAFMIRIAR